MSSVINETIAIAPPRPKRNRRKQQRGPAAIEETIQIAVPSVSGKARRRRRARQRARQLAGIGGNTLSSFARPRGEGLGSVIMGELGVDHIAGTSNTVSGLLWVNKILDPCHPSMGVNGVPDADVSTVATPQFKSTRLLDNSISGMHQVSEKEWDETATWNFIHVTDWSTMRTCVVKWQGDLRGDPADVALYVTESRTGDFIPSAENWMNSGTGISKLRLTYAGVTFDPSMPTLADQGRAIAAQIKQRYEKVNTIPGVGTGPGRPAASSVYQWGLAATPNGVTTLANTAEFISNLTIIDERSMTAPAKVGCYLPARWNDPTHAYVNCNEAVNSNPPTEAIADRVYHVPPFVRDNVALTSTAYTPAYSEGIWLSSLFGDNGETMPWSASVYYAAGLDSESNYQLTYRYGLEVQLTIAGTNPWAPFTHASPEHDQLALEAADRVRTAMDSAFPADYNFLDKLWGVVKGVASKVVPGLAKGIPVVGPMLGDLIGGLFPKAKSMPVRSENEYGPLDSLPPQFRDLFSRMMR
jgi:hypothetical protein